MINCKISLHCDDVEEFQKLFDVKHDMDVEYIYIDSQQDYFWFSISRWGVVEITYKKFSKSRYEEVDLPGLSGMDRWTSLKTKMLTPL